MGLIGGSLGMALRKGRIARRVIGFSRREATIRRARARGAIDDGDTELCPEWLGQSDLVVLATPPLAVVPTAKKIAQLTTGRLLLTDVASTKARIVQALERTLPERILFVGGHPMAGSEQSGLSAAEFGLFQGALCLLTPTPRTHRQAVSKIAALWRSLGCRVRTLSPQEHDARIAQISHLPHLSAVGLTLTPELASLRLASSGFSDATRIAASDPVMWAEIFRTNSVSVLKSLRRFLRQMEALEGLIRTGHWAKFRRCLKEAQRRRRQL